MISKLGENVTYKNAFLLPENYPNLEIIRNTY